MFVVLLKVQCFGLGGNSLAGIVFEFPAFFAIFHHAPLGAKVGVVAEKSAVLTVFAGTRQLFAE